MKCNVTTHTLRIEADMDLKFKGSKCYGSKNIKTTSRSMPDPFQCTLRIRATKNETNFLKSLYSPFLEGIDPTFQFICLEESEEFIPALLEWKENDLYINEVCMECPALSIVLFVRESVGRLSAEAMQRYLYTSPWKFHHRIELPKDVRPQITARQDFFKAFKDLPLWSVCPVHYGNELLRFHIVVRHFQQMRAFYERIIGVKARNCSFGFCYIPVYTQMGLEIQLSMKSLPKVIPKPSTDVARLRFKVRNIEDLLPDLVGSPLPVPNEKGAWLTNDPDGNVIILEETVPRQKVRTSLITLGCETGSLETNNNTISDGSSYSEKVKFNEAFENVTPDFV